MKVGHTGNNPAHKKYMFRNTKKYTRQIKGSDTGNEIRLKI
jgi:hypothetical protein